MDRKHIITACAGILLAGLAVAGFIGWRSEHKKVEDLQARVEEMKKPVVQLAVQDVSKPIGVSTYKTLKAIPQPYRTLAPVIEGVKRVMAQNAKGGRK